MKITPAGDRAVLAELGDVIAGVLHGAASAVGDLPDVVACIVGQRSLYIVCRDAPRVDRIASVIRAPRTVRAAGKTRRIPVSFRDEYGPDQAEFLAHIGLVREQFLRQIATLRLTARYIGFRGGFAYLDGWPAEWSMPRRPTSRPRVARGTFAVAGGTAAFYPIETPGGWNLLGRTSELLEHVIAAGDQIVIDPNMNALPPSAAAPAPAAQSFPLDLIEPRLTRVVSRQDWSQVAIGIAPGGPFDLVAAAHARSAVGDAPDAPVLECALTGPLLAARWDVVLSWFGANAEISVDGIEVSNPQQFQARKGQRISVGRISGGMRGYLAAGTSRGPVARLTREDRLTIRALAGPHESGIRDLMCEVTPQLDRVGIRMRAISPSGLRGPADLPSCGMQCGTIQLHPDGSVVAMGPDHPVTGGYLQPMTVISADLWKLAQLVPGDRARFVVQSAPYT